MLIGLMGMLSACQPESTLTLSGLDKQNFQRVVDGDTTELVVLKNKQGMEACITNYGARLVSLMVPDRMEKWKMW